MLAKVASHALHAQFQLGRPLVLGTRSYRVRGYVANRLATSFEHEPQITEVLAHALAARAGAFVDVGANVGQTLIKVLALDPSRRYVGFEPQVACCTCVHQFIVDNGLRHASVLPIALSDSNGMVQMFASDLYDEMASLRSDPHHAAPSYVCTRVGDEVLAELGVDELAVLKLDVEGSELSALRGLERTIHRVRPWVFFEVLPNFEKDASVEPDAVASANNREIAARIYAFFADAGFGISLIRDEGGAVPIDRFELDDRAAFQGFNYVAIPEG